LPQSRRLKTILKRNHRDGKWREKGEREFPTFVGGGFKTMRKTAVEIGFRVRKRATKRRKRNWRKGTKGKKVQEGKNSRQRKGDTTPQHL